MADSVNYDLVVIGGGIGGYTAAIRAAQLGKKTAIVEKDKVGGTCLHQGCIPSKTLLCSAELFAAFKNGHEYGIKARELRIDYARVQARKQEIVQRLHTGLQNLLKKHRIDVYAAHGRIIGPSIFSPRAGAVALETDDDEAQLPTLVAKHTLIATGSRPRLLPGWEADGEFVLLSDHALAMEELPASIVIVGGGAIGVEWASMLHDFGVDVVLLEAESRLLPEEDEEISRELERQLKERGVKIYTACKVQPDTLQRKKDSVQFQAVCREETITFEAGKCLVSIGRHANVERIGLENTTIQMENGFIKVNRYLQTAESNIYAVGDVIGGLMLAHKAGHEAILAVDHMYGREMLTRDDLHIPRCIYSRPEVAAIGLTEKQAREQGFMVKVGKMPFYAVGKALVCGHAEGFVKVVADGKNGDILGVHMIGPHVTEQISAAGIARLLDATPWEAASFAFPHPTLSEALGEAMLGVDGKHIGI